MSSVIEYFKLLIEIQLFYALAVTLIVYTLPQDSIHYISLFQQDTNIDMTDISNKIQSSLERQVNIPVVDLGALVFYSGNIIVDLMLNFFTAIPSMFSILLSVLFAFINVDAFLATQVKLFATTLITIMYVIAMLQFIMNVRARGTII